MLAHRFSSLALIFSLFVSLGSSSSQDFAALLEFKSSAAAVGVDSDQLANWGDSKNPCRDSWVGVTCNARTHRVTRLVLENLNLSGDVRPLSQLGELRVLSLKGNQLSSLPVNFSSWPNLKQIYLSRNRFRGGFPAGICDLRRLLRVDLSYNNFSGEVPVAKIGRLSRLLTLRLEGNSFTGSLSSVRSLTSVVDFNVSGNKLSGQIPAWMSRFPAAAFAGNKNLCGKPLPNNCTIPAAVAGSGETRLATPKTKHSGERVKILLFIAVDAVAVLAAVVTVAWCCYRSKKQRMMRDDKSCGSHEIRGTRGTFTWVPLGVTALDVACGGGSGRRGTPGRDGGQGEMVTFEGCKGFNRVEDLLKSSADLLGKGRAGTTYKVLVDGGGVVVVKRVRRRMRRKKEVDGLLTQIGELRHKNVVSVRAYHHSNDELLLVNDYLPNGSLHSLLHENRGPGRTPVNWTTRMKLASDAARGLAFLHQQSKPKLFHGHLTSSNIVINAFGNALISDTGLCQLFPSSPPSEEEPYQAPELFLHLNQFNGSSSIKYTQKCDVYSFGVILLEILTGKTATGEGETGLVRWVRHVVRSDWSAKEVFDFELSGDKKMEEMKVVLQVALLCLASSPRDRPRMSQVYKMIEDVRTNGGLIAGNLVNFSFKLNDLSDESSSSSSF